MSAEQIIESWKKNQFKPIYWLEGDEPFFIDQVMQYAENKILTPSEADFNLSVFYGKDADWAEVVNACRRYPMFAEKQVVVLKEAQQMKDVNVLESYVAKPMPTTIFVVSYKEKKVDARTTFAKTLKKNGEVLTTKKMYDSQLPDWINQMVKSKGFTITPKALQLVINSIGNDISRISNEINKLSVNLEGTTAINEDHIENYIGISKDFNVFEMQSALGNKDLTKAMRIVQYFGSNPKAGPMQMVLPSLYGFFSKVAMVFAAGSSDTKIIADTIGVNSFFVRDYITAANKYGYPGVEKVLLLLHEYNLRSIGVHNGGAESAELMKEMVVKMML
ncbi:DNA polymerase III subunit delta [Rhizosphaericola mali]|uniref:DNA polymerase III subunit delta n=1 Tax=Rhizosphaericola mali TaxID=2545455 RepID=A0A5P2G6B2_9BACT|nr:DNA polymerase III subunit delta [Rhizosphaericola mali]QES89472.1 DNA polymerase III subunit delta [Rhizosphaericola mali]